MDTFLAVLNFALVLLLVWRNRRQQDQIADLRSKAVANRAIRDAGWKAYEGVFPERDAALRRAKRAEEIGRNTARMLRNVTLLAWDQGLSDEAKDAVRTELDAWGLELTAEVGEPV